jgi:hypothetical protein
VHRHAGIKLYSLAKSENRKYDLGIERFDVVIVPPFPPLIFPTCPDSSSHHLHVRGHLHPETGLMRSPTCGSVVDGGIPGMPTVQRLITLLLDEVNFWSAQLHAGSYCITHGWHAITGSPFVQAIK